MQNLEIAPLRRLPPKGLLPYGWLVTALTVMLIAPAVARADNAMVLVESVSAGITGITEMSYVNAGTHIDLGHSGVVVLDHLADCSRETVTGGSLTVGARQSQVDGGSIARSSLDCDGQQLQLAASESTGGGQVYRTFSGPLGQQADLLKLSTTEPVILATAPGSLQITRIDQAAAPLNITVGSASTAQPAAIDLAVLHLTLTPGAIYCATLGPENIKFQVDPDAAGADKPLLARLLPI